MSRYLMYDVEGFVALYMSYRLISFLTNERAWHSLITFLTFSSLSFGFIVSVVLKVFFFFFKYKFTTLISEISQIITPIPELRNFLFIL